MFGKSHNEEFRKKQADNLAISMPFSDVKFIETDRSNNIDPAMEKKEKISYRNTISVAQTKKLLNESIL